MQSDRDRDEELDAALGYPEEPANIDDVLDKLNYLEEKIETNNIKLGQIQFAIAIIFLLFVWNFFW